MQVKVVFDHKEIEAMMNKLNGHPYNKKHMATVGVRVRKAHAEYLKIKKKDEPSENQMTIDMLLKTFGGRVVD